MKKSTIINDGKEVINTELKGIKKLNKAIDKNFDKAVRALAKLKGRVIVTGVGKSGIPIQNDKISSPCRCSASTSANTTNAFSVPESIERSEIVGIIKFRYFFVSRTSVGFGNF